MKIYSICFVAILGIIISNNAQAANAHVAVAANFRHCMQELITEVEQESGHHFVLSFGSSGKFYAQIKHGAPYDLFFSADVVKPETLEREGFGISGSRFTYATGRLALVSRLKESAITLKETLTERHFNRLAIANPKLAPYGMASIEALEHLGLQENTKSKWVQGENIAQAYQFVDSGNADLGFVALSQVINQKKYQSAFWLIPDSWYKPIKQQSIVLNRGKDNAAILALIKFMNSNKGMKILTSFGYLPPEKTST